MADLLKKFRSILASPPVPFLVTSRTERRIQSLIQKAEADAVILNVGAGYSDYGSHVINLDIYDSGTIDVIALAQELPFSDSCIDLVILQGVLEHVEDADATLKECVRVLKSGGIFYTEMPFLQPYHESPIDLRRCTKPGLNKICEPLIEVETGIHIGPASTMTWIIRELLTGILSFGNPNLYPRINSLVGWVVFPLKYADHLLEKLPYLHRIASSFYFIGRKV